MTTHLMRRLLCLGAACAMLLGVLSSAGSVRAAGLTVNTLADENDGSCIDAHCSLRDAIGVASSGDTIQFNVKGTIKLKLGELTIDKNLTIAGPGAKSLTISGNKTSRVMSIAPPATVSISGLTISNGKLPPYDDGGGIFNVGTLTLRDCIFSNNGGDYGGALHNDGQLTVTGCTFSNNVSTSADGGGLHNDGTATITRSSFSGNSAKTGSGGAIMNEEGGSLTVIESTFSNNNAVGANGGAIENIGSTLKVERTTFSGNRAMWGGALKNEGSAASAQLINSTFSGNNATSRGGAVDNGNGSTLNVLNSTLVKNSSGIAKPSGTVTVINTIIANSKDKNCEASFGVASTNNLSTDDSCSPGFLQVTQAQLALGSLTGKPAYYPVKPGSSAIEKGTNTGCPAVDQRGYPRPLDGDGDGSPVCDVGSFEAELPANMKWDGQFASPGMNGSVMRILNKGADIYVGGDFTSAGGLTANHISRYSTAKNGWYSLGGGVDGPVYALLAVGNKIYVGGGFSKAWNPDTTQVLANNIAIWDASQNRWSPLIEGTTNGVGDEVYALASIGSNVFVAGAFTQIGPHTPQHIARWNTSTQTWDDLQEGVNDEVYALEIIGQQLYVGGKFTSAGNKPTANRIAVFDTKSGSWSVLGDDTKNGVDGTVWALESTGSYLCVGGAFNVNYRPDGDTLRRNILCGNTKAPHDEWHMGSGLNSTATSLVVVGNDLYVGGHFTLANPGLDNQLAVKHIARWNKNTKQWFSLGVGVDNDAIALAKKGQDVYVGGMFLTAGEKPSPYLARWKGP